MQQQKVGNFSQDDVEKKLVAASLGQDSIQQRRAPRSEESRVYEGIATTPIRAFALDPSNSKVMYAGTEPAAVWRSEDEGRSWKELTGVRSLADERKWTYPVPMIQPHVRSIAVDPQDSRRLCVAAQVGGILLSDDGGNSWRDVRYPIDLDVHSVTFDAAKSNVIYAATGGGENFPDRTPPPKGRPLYCSTDGGKSWESISNTFHRTYSVPVRVHPKDSQTLYIGVAEEPPPLWLKRATKANGALMRSTDGGVNWQQLTDGLPNPFESMVECIEFDTDQPDHLFIGTGGEGPASSNSKKVSFITAGTGAITGKSFTSVSDHLRPGRPMMFSKACISI